MLKKLAIVAAVLLAFGATQAFATPAPFCWDNTDQVIKKLKRLDLNTEQLKDVFVYQEAHRDVMKRAHTEGLGCRVHENHEAQFVKQSVGVLTDEQFEKYTGRERNEEEVLIYDNYLLVKEVAAL